MASFYINRWVLTNGPKLWLPDAHTYKLCHTLETLYSEGDQFLTSSKFIKEAM